MHYYTFNIADYRKDTGHLTTLEHGIYRQLLDWYYLEEVPIPKETQTVIRRLRLGSESDMQALQNVLNDFFVVQDDGYHQLRCDDQIERYHDKAEVNKVNGKLGGRPKKTQTVISGNPNESEPKGNQEPITNNQKPKRESAVAPPPDVDEQVWKDWLTLRKAKKAPVTETVVTNARKEAEKAGVTFQHFLMIWCARGSQGLQADWLKPAERGQSNAVSFAQQAADIARTTVPSRIDRDPLLVQLDEDFKKAVPMPDSVRKALSALTRRVSTNEVNTDELKGV